MARRKRRVIRAENLGEEIKKILNEYGEDLAKDIDEVAQKVSQKGRSAVRNEAIAKFNSRKEIHRYARGWQVNADVNRLYISYEIYNKSQPTLTHLLENGHEMRGWAEGKPRFPGRPHIDPVAEELSEEFEKEVLDAIQRSE